MEKTGVCALNDIFFIVSKWAIHSVLVAWFLILYPIIDLICFCRNNSYYLLITYTIADKIYTLSSIFKWCYYQHFIERPKEIEWVAQGYRDGKWWSWLETRSASLQSNCFPTKCRQVQAYWNRKWHNLNIAVLAHNYEAKHAQMSHFCKCSLFPVVIRIFQRCHLNLQHTSAHDIVEIHQDEWAVDKKQPDSIFMCYFFK